MCGRYTLRRINWYRDVKGFFPPPFEEFSETRLRFNIAPSQLMPIIVNEAGVVSPREAKWGFVPHWAGEKPGAKPINARCEAVATNPMFRDAFNRHRCLVPADGFYEWQGAKPPKVPYFIKMKDNSVFMFAGVQAGDTFAILTTDANDLMRPIHSRMPVILGPEDYQRWLDPEVCGKDVADLLRSSPAEKMESFPVSTRVNSVKNDSPELIERFEPPEISGNLWTQTDNPPKDR